jgi:hypothetical protein
MPLFGNQFEYRSQPSALDVIVPRSRELDQIEAVPEWIGHISHAPIFADLYFTVESGTEAAQSGNHLVEIGHDEIEVYRRPVRPKSRLTFAAPSSATAGRSARRKIGRLAPASSTQRGPSCRFSVSPSPPQ